MNDMGTSISELQSRVDGLLARIVALEEKIKEQEDDVEHERRRVDYLEDQISDVKFRMAP